MFTMQSTPEKLTSGLAKIGGLLSWVGILAAIAKVVH